MKEECPECTWREIARRLGVSERGLRYARSAKHGSGIIVGAADRAARSDLARIPFHGVEVLSVEVGGKPHAAVRPVVESLGLNYSGQIQRLKRKSWAVVCMTHTTGADGKTYEMAVVPVRTLTMLLATIDESRVAESARPLLIAYQAEVADVIEQYWTQGGVINPRVPVQRESSTVDPFADHPLVQQADLLREISVRFAENDVRWTYQQQINVEHGQLIHQTEMRLDSYESHIGWLTGMQYCSQHGLSTKVEFVNPLGRKAGYIGRRDGLTAGSAADDKYQKVNKWPEYVWDEALRSMNA